MFDYLSLDDELTDDERAVRDEARELVDSLRPFGELFLEGEFPDVFDELGDRGLLAPHLRGGSPRAYGVAMRELEAGDSGLRSAVSVQGALVAYPVARYGTDAQRDEYLDDLLDGETVGCFALTEPDVGSAPHEMGATAHREGDGYVLNGTKRWVTNSPIADVALVWARDDGGDGDVRGFLVPTDTDGVHVEPIDGLLSLRISESAEVTLDDVHVPDDAVLDVRGMRGPLSCLNQARYGIAWGAVGAARDAFEHALDYAKGREQWGRAVAGFQLQQEKFADCATRITTAELIARRLADLKESDELEPHHVSMGKRHSAEVARNVTRTAREIMGGNGVLADHPPMRHMLNAETVYTYEGTHDVHSLIMGAEITGEPAFEG
ncbi:acyl-CoA dehydrogenase family protein [Haladaptatus sp. F3-133]|jgi:glutaryl-CoA dehydrogenase|uniref:glutaryl-CoA dehydrogenase (ETF) n=1 Tax=Halorutilus salinus TaxID=2487751 RepID=A0A9Q4GHE8_9EURY|nr:acyl-CoA dehydrogenase family protein [Halorutilus salinus]MCX2818720.1 acyl-CoA dehydrogenase family protein [Halorutilus salinus]